MADPHSELNLSKAQRDMLLGLVRRNRRSTADIQNVSRALIRKGLAKRVQRDGVVWLELTHAGYQETLVIQQAEK